MHGNIAPAYLRTGDLTERVDHALVPLGDNARGQRDIERSRYIYSGSAIATPPFPSNPFKQSYLVPPGSEPQ